MKRETLERMKARGFDLADDGPRRKRYRVAIGSSYQGPLEIVLELEAENASRAAKRARDLMFEPYGWSGQDFPLRGLSAREKATILTNPGYFPTPEDCEEI
jgi:hypothetical protein